MKTHSISARLTAWYALTATATLACLFVAGYFMLEDHLVRQLDQLNHAQFNQLKARLGPSYQALTPQVIDERIRETTESGSALFYIDMHGPMTNRFFRSHNLRGRSIPDIVGQREFTTEVAEIGPLTISPRVATGC